MQTLVDMVYHTVYILCDILKPDTVQKGTKKEQVMVFAYNAEIQGMICFHVQLTICPVISRSVYNPDACSCL